MPRRCPLELALGLVLFFTGCAQDPISVNGASPSASPGFEYSAAVPGTSLAECTGTPNLYHADYDYDGFNDECEYRLALAFRPILMFGPGEMDPTRETYWAAFYYGDGLHIAYLLGYHRDEGTGPWPLPGGHEGDSEFIIADVQWSPLDGRWRFVGAFLSAHWRAGGYDRSGYYTSSDFHSILGVGWPAVFVSVNKHANYPSVAVCENFQETGCGGGPWDTAQVLPERNVGQSLRHLVDCTHSYLPAYQGQECLWTGTSFRGWIAQPHHGDPPTPYGTVLAFFEERYGFPPGPDPQTAIIGPLEVQPYATCSWWVSPGPVAPPYGFAWRVDYEWQADEDGTFTYTAPVTGSFTIMVRITGGDGQVGWGVQTVTVSYSAPECLDT